MESRVSFAKTLLACAAACVLAACGSDDDKQDDLPSPDAVSKYVGTWDTGCKSNTATGDSVQAVLKISQQGNGLKVHEETKYFAGENCQVHVSTSDSETDEPFPWLGQKIMELYDGRRVNGDLYGVHLNLPEFGELDLWYWFYLEGDNTLYAQSDETFLMEDEIPLRNLSPFHKK